MTAQKIALLRLLLDHIEAGDITLADAIRAIKEEPVEPLQADLSAFEEVAEIAEAAFEKWEKDSAA